MAEGKEALVSLMDPPPIIDEKEFWNKAWALHPDFTRAEGVFAGSAPNYFPFPVLRSFCQKCPRRLLLNEGVWAYAVYGQAGFTKSAFTVLSKVCVEDAAAWPGGLAYVVTQFRKWQTLVDRAIKVAKGEAEREGEKEEEKKEEKTKKKQRKKAAVNTVAIMNGCKEAVQIYLETVIRVMIEPKSRAFACAAGAAIGYAEDLLKPEFRAASVKDIEVIFKRWCEAIRELKAKSKERLDPAAELTKTVLGLTHVIYLLAHVLEEVEEEEKIKGEKKKKKQKKKAAGRKYPALQGMCQEFLLKLWRGELRVEGEFFCERRQAIKLYLDGPSKKSDCAGSERLQMFGALIMLVDPTGSTYGPAWVNGKALLNNKSLSIPKVSGKWIDAMGACPIGRWLPHLAPGKDHAFVFDKHVGMVRHSQSRKKTTKSPAAILQSTMERRGQSFAWSKDEIAASHRSVSPDLNLLAHFFDEAAWVDSTGAQSNPWHEPCGSSKAKSLTDTKAAKMEKWHWQNWLQPLVAATTKIKKKEAREAGEGKTVIEISDSEDEAKGKGKGKQKAKRKRKLTEKEEGKKKKKKAEEKNKKKKQIVAKVYPAEVLALSDFTSASVLGTFERISAAEVRRIKSFPLAQLPCGPGSLLVADKSLNKPGVYICCDPSEPYLWKGPYHVKKEERAMKLALIRWRSLFDYKIQFAGLAEGKKTKEEVDKLRPQMTVVLEEDCPALAWLRIQNMARVPCEQWITERREHPSSSTPEKKHMVTIVERESMGIIQASEVPLSIWHAHPRLLSDVIRALIIRFICSPPAGDSGLHNIIVVLPKAVPLMKTKDWNDAYLCNVDWEETRMAIPKCNSATPDTCDSTWWAHVCSRAPALKNRTAMERSMRHHSALIVADMRRTMEAAGPFLLDSAARIRLICCFASLLKLCGI